LLTLLLALFEAVGGITSRLMLVQMQPQWPQKV